MLDGHPGIRNPGEFDFFFDYLGDDGTEPSVEQFQNALSKNRIFHARGMQMEDADSYEEMLIRFVDQMRKGDQWVVLNVHRNFHHIKTYFPDAKIIHLFRDPRDVARSSIAMGWVGHVHYGVEHWLETERSWDRLRAELADDQFIEFSFEDLIAEPEANLQDACRLLGVEYTEEMIKNLQNTTYETPDVSLTYQWKRKLSPREIGLVERRAQELMIDRGYELTGQECYSPGWFESMKLWIGNKTYRARFAINRFGLKLYLLERLTDRLGLVKLHEGFLRQKHVIEMECVK